MRRSAFLESVVSKCRCRSALFQRLLRKSHKNLCYNIMCPSIVSIICGRKLYPGRTAGFMQEGGDAILLRGICKFADRKILILYYMLKYELFYAVLRTAGGGRGNGCRLCGGGALCVAVISSPFSSVLRLSFGKQYEGILNRILKASLFQIKCIPYLLCRNGHH